MECPGPTPAPFIPAKSIAFGPEELGRFLHYRGEMTPFAVSLSGAILPSRR